MAIEKQKAQELSQLDIQEVKQDPIVIKDKEYWKKWFEIHSHNDGLWHSIEDCCNDRCYTYVGYGHFYDADHPIVKERQASDWFEEIEPKYHSAFGGEDYTVGDYLLWRWQHRTKYRIRKIGEDSDYLENIHFESYIDFENYRFLDKSYFSLIDYANDIVAGHNVKVPEHARYCDAPGPEDDSDILEIARFCEMFDHYLKVRTTKPFDEWLKQRYPENYEDALKHGASERRRGRPRLEWEQQRLKAIKVAQYRDSGNFTYQQTADHFKMSETWVRNMIKDFSPGGRFENPPSAEK